MIAADTNVLLRFLVTDDESPEQSAAAAAEFARARGSGVPIFLPLVTVIEAVWVLDRHLRVAKEEILDLLEALLLDPLVHLDRRASVSRARERWKNGPADFADCLALELALAEGATEMLTFDRKLGRSKGARLLKT